MTSHLDHLVLTTTDEAACVDFYTRMLGMTLETFCTGGDPALNGLLAGTGGFTITTPPPRLPHLRAGRHQAQKNNYQINSWLRLSCLRKRLFLYFFR